jgi:hypothetical protein
MDFAIAKVNGDRQYTITGHHEEKIIRQCMTMRTTISIIIIFCSLLSCHEKKAVPKADFVIGNGQIPNIAKDESGTIHLTYGLGDSIMYTSSSDKGNSFVTPSLVAVLPGLYSFAMRGPQIVAANNGIMITACTKEGNIYSYYKENNNWKRGSRVNDLDTAAKEGLMALASNGESAYAVWLDLRGNKRNKIYGAKSNDGGKTWSKNTMIYTSPDTSVCPCCKPSVVMKGNNVYVMFRNWLDGNRDLYLTQSSNGGTSFGQAQKLGIGSWELNACPMDGGGLTINTNGKVQTIWQRKGNIFTAVPGIPEVQIGKGRNCTIETVNNKNMYAWTENGKVIFMKPDSQKVVLGSGSLPVLKALDNQHAICVWENEKQIHAAVVEL